MTRSPRRPWTGYDSRTLRQYAAKGLSLREIARRMGRVPGVIRDRAARLGIEVIRVCVKTPWTPAEDAVLRARYATTGTTELARELGRTTGQVFNRANSMGLKKDRAFMSEVHGARVRNNYATRFQKGQRPWNKGAKGSTGLHPNCQRTQFKKGRPPQLSRNYQPIGTERFDAKRGGVIRKISDDQSLYPAARWMPVSRLVWEAANGPVPPGHIVRFKDGMHTADSSRITLDRLELVTKAENMRRNSYHTRYPKEVAQLIQLKGALNRKINHRSKA